MHSHAGAWERGNKHRLNLVPTLLRGNAYHTCSMLLLPPPLLEKLRQRYDHDRMRECGLLSAYIFYTGPELVYTIEIRYTKKKGRIMSIMILP